MERRGGRLIVPAVIGRMLTRALAGLLVASLVALGGGGPVAANEGAPDSLGLEATYDVTASIKWRTRRLNVLSTALITNRTDAAVEALTFNAVPAKIGKMQLRSVVAGDQPAGATISDQNIIVTLPVPLGPGEQTAVTIDYSAWFSAKSANKKWLFAKLNGIATAYRWIPWLSRAYNFLTPTFGETFVTAVSPEVKVSITSDKAALKYATTGRRTSVSGATHTFVANNVRDFNFTASPKYLVTNRTHNGIAVTYYHINLSQTKLQTWTERALKRFGSKLGAYPYAEFTVAESHTGYAMESPGLIWIPQNTPASNVAYLTVHEIAHQWFYGVVGNNQAVQPFSDEALAEFLTRDLLGHRASRCAQDNLDRRVYDYSAGCYYEVVYVQGDAYIEAYRLRVGDTIFWRGLRKFYQQNSFKIAGIRDLWDILDAEAGGTGGGHQGRFPTVY